MDWHSNFTPEVCPKTSGWIAEFSEHEAAWCEAQEFERLSVEVLPTLASRWQRLSQAMKRLTIQRLGRTTNPLTRSERLSTSRKLSARGAACHQC